MLSKCSLLRKRQLGGPPPAERRLLSEQRSTPNESIPLLSSKYPPNRTETATARPGGIDQWECRTAGTRVKCVFPPSANQKAGIFRFLPGCTQENANELCSLPSFREKGVFPFPGKKEQDSGYPWISSIKVNPPSFLHHRICVGVCYDFFF